VNPALPGGAIGLSEPEAGAWAVGARLAYTFIPYGELQQGTEPAPNPSELAVDVHLGTLEAEAAAPTGTSLDLQLPFGSLRTSSVDGDRDDGGVGDLEVRVRQSSTPLFRVPRLAAGLALGLVVPTGPYVARSGAANLPTEATYLTLGRGVPWWLVETDATYAVAKRASVVAQVGARGPLSRTSDGFAWGSEVRVAIGARATATRRVSALLLADVQWRDGATEPDPFGDGRLDAASAGGWQWSLSPGATVALPGSFAITAGLRIPLHEDVIGNQLVPQIGGFVSLAYARPVARSTPPAAFQPTAGQITVVDYWASWCAPCKKITRALEEAAPRWPDVRIVRIDATDWPDESAPALPEGARELPVVEIFDRDGARRAILVGEASTRVVQEVDALRRSRGTR
jgi:thioredoxin 1